MYKETVNLLKIEGVEFEKGLSADEIAKIEGIYQIHFPLALHKFLREALPISKGFYNWRDITSENIDFIKQIMNKPIQGIRDMAEEVYWCEEWGDEPEEKKDVVKVVKEKLNEAPKLLPIYEHRYMPMILEDNPPIISIHDTDVIYYGENLEDYFEVEFGNKEQEEINFENIKSILFWSDIM